MTGVKLDSYSIYARAFPIYITIVPVALALFPILPEGYDWKFGGATDPCFLTSFLLMQANRRRQRKKASKCFVG